jgi:hypothetical protein
MFLVLASAGLFAASAQSEDAAGKRTILEVLAAADDKAAPPDAPPVPPAVRVAAPTGVLQPSSSVEATALAIAYHALREAKPTPEAVGKYAAEMMNAFSAARK